MQIKIREVARKNKDISLYELAKRLVMPQQTIYSWNNGRTQPNYANMDKLCSELDCTVGDLFIAEPVQSKLDLSI